MEQYCIYLRKSRSDYEAEARGEGETLARHEKALLDLAKRLSLNVTEIYREVVSGDTIAARPMMRRLLSEVEQGIWSGVLVMEVERLARGDTMDQGKVAQTFKFAETLIITPMKTYNPNDEYDEEYFEFGLYMSRREYKTINRRLQRGRVASVNEGKFIGSQTPYGYDKKRVDKGKGYMLVPNPDEADVVKLIYDLYAYGELQPDGTRKRLGYRLIAKKLNELNMPTRNGGKWYVYIVNHILTNPVYMGKIRWGKRPQIVKMSNGTQQVTRPRVKEEKVALVADGLHEPLVSREVFDLVQKLRLEKEYLPLRGSYKIKNPLAGILTCKLCGHNFMRRVVKKKHETLSCLTLDCPNGTVSLKYIEDKILKALAAWVKDYKMSWDAEKSHNNDTQIALKKKALKNLESEMESFDKQIDRIHNLLEKEVYTVDVFLDRSKKIAERSEEVKKLKEDLIKELEELEKKKDGRAQIMPKVEYLLEVYDTLPSPAAKNQMLKEVLDKVVIYKERNPHHQNRPDDFEITLFPKFPKN